MNCASPKCRMCYPGLWCRHCQMYPQRVGRLSKLCCYVRRDSRKLNVRMEAPSLSLSLPAPVSSSVSFSTFSIFIADVGRGSRPGEAAFRSVLISTDRRLQISPVFIFLDGGQQKPASLLLRSCVHRKAGPGRAVTKERNWLSQSYTHAHVQAHASGPDSRL